VLTEAEKRLDRWRQAVSRDAGAPAEGVLAQVRRHLADDLDAPRALAAIDAWTELPPVGGRADAAVDLVARTADALLGVRL
jgi:L-cysteine:1D-myo-inositol 2-amino-2-deoxy-alpha-D-glucopyranoside ligase